MCVNICLLQSHFCRPDGHTIIGSLILARQPNHKVWMAKWKSHHRDLVGDRLFMAKQVVMHTDILKLHSPVQPFSWAVGPFSNTCLLALPLGLKFSF